jgi:hypothetical protein
MRVKAYLQHCDPCVSGSCSAMVYLPQLSLLVYEYCCYSFILCSTALSWKSHFRLGDVTPEAGASRCHIQCVKRNAIHTA